MWLHVDLGIILEIDGNFNSSNKLPLNQLIALYLKCFTLRKIMTKAY